MALCIPLRIQIRRWQDIRMQIGQEIYQHDVQLLVTFFKCKEITVSWCSKRQGCVARSTTEAEYIALSTASQEAVWLRRLLESVLKKQDKPATLYEDNQGAIELTKNPKFHNRTKHIDVSYHYAREQVDNKKISIKYCRTENMLADVMTKGLSKVQFEKFRNMLGLIKIK